MHLNFHMCLQNMTPPKFLWVLCCVRYDKIVSVFFSTFLLFFFFFTFQFLLHYFFFFRFFFFFFFFKVVFFKKKKKKFLKKKKKKKKKERNSFFVVFFCKYLLIKGGTGGRTDSWTDTQTNRSVGLSTQTIDVKKKWNIFLCYTARMVKKWLQLFFFSFFFFYTEQF